MAPRHRPWHAAPIVLALLFAIAYLIWQPRTVDLAAHTFRADLFGKEGFTIWNGQWYGGHHTPAYSVLSPPLAWLLSPPVALALSALACAALFPPLARGWFGERSARWGSIWFGAAAATLLFTSRLPFAIGVAFGLAALLALQRRRYRLAIGLAVLCPLGSPVAGLFLAMAGVAYAIAERRDTRASAWRGWRSPPPPSSRRVFLVAGVPRGRLGAVPEVGLRPDPAVRARLPDRAPARAERAALGRRPLRRRLDARARARDADGRQRRAPRRALRRARSSCARSGARPWTRRLWALPVLAAGFASLAMWQWSPAVRDVIKYIEDPAAKADYFDAAPRVPLPAAGPAADRDPVHALALGGLRGGDGPGARARLAAPARHAAATRSSTRAQLDRLTYASWLSDNAVRYVALPSAKPDKSSYRERALIEKGLPYLRLRWKSEDWRVYEVLLPAPLVIAQGDAKIVLEQFQSDEVLLDVKRPGEAIVKVRWTPYWFASHACVEPYGDWTKVIADAGGLRAPVHAVRARTAGLARPPLRRLHGLAALATLDARAVLPPASRSAGSGLAPERALAPERLARRHPAARPVRRRVLPVPDRPRHRGRPGRPRLRERAQPGGRRARAGPVLRAGPPGLGRGQRLDHRPPPAGCT